MPVEQMRLTDVAHEIRVAVLSVSCAGKGLGFLEVQVRTSLLEGFYFGRAAEAPHGNVVISEQKQCLVQEGRILVLALFGGVFGARKHFYKPRKMLVAPLLKVVQVAWNLRLFWTGAARQGLFEHLHAGA